MSVKLNTEQKVKITVQPVTSKGNPARIHGVPGWSTSDPSIISLVVAPDGLSAEAVSQNKVGISTISVSADADLSGGVREIVGSIEIQVGEAEAASLNLVAGTPSST